MNQTRYRLALMMHFARINGENVFDDPSIITRNYLQHLGAVNHKTRHRTTLTRKKRQLKNRHKMG
jgi:hypothetical protein